MAKKIKKPSLFSKMCSKFLVFIVICLVFLIALKSNADLRDLVYKNLLQNNINFTKINEIYKKHFGTSLPLYKEKETNLVSSEKLEYTKATKYKNGVKLTVKENYLVPSMNNGLVIYSGEKDGYGKTVIVQRADNIEIWYCNLNNLGANLYDYIKKGATIGEVSDSTLYMVFTKEGKTLDYQKYI